MAFVHRPALRTLTFVVVLPLLAGCMFSTGALSHHVASAIGPLVFLIVAMRKLSTRQACLASLVFGMAAFGFAFWWFYNIFGWACLALHAILSSFILLFALAFKAIDRQAWPDWQKALAVACCWTTTEFIRAEHFWLDFPWLTLGHAFGAGSSAVLLPWVGVYGVGFLLALVSVSLADVMHRKNSGWLALLVGVVYAILIFTKKPEPPSGTAITVAAIQSERYPLEEFLKASSDIKPPTDILLWPEESIPYDVFSRPKGLSKLQAFTKQNNAVLVCGTQETIGKGPAWHNTALTLGPDGELGRHYKIHTVHLFDDGTPGTTAVPVRTPKGTFGTPVCYDCDYEGVVRQMTAAGAEFFIVPMMDAMEWSETQHLQHAELFRIRAAENARWMAVCGTSGVTQIIDPYGKTVTSIEPMKIGSLLGKIYQRTDLTFYTRYGWLFPWCAVAGALAALAMALVADRRRALSR